MPTTIPNKYKVTLKLWASFKGLDAKRVYNRMMDFMLHNQSFVIHPKMEKIPPHQWHTICHNAACTAAWAVNNDHLKRGDMLTDVNLRTGKEVKVNKIK